jgi:hypothetical protein
MYSLPMFVVINEKNKNTPAVQAISLSKVVIGVKDTNGLKRIIKINDTYTLTPLSKKSKYLGSKFIIPVYATTYNK